MKMKFQLLTYVLWGNPKDGYEVNDVYPHGEIEVNVRKIPYRKDFSFYPSDRQLNQAIGARGLTWDGDPEYTLYANDKNGNPACELRRLS